MTEGIERAELHALLDRATDAIEPPTLAGTALRTAHRRRARRRGAAATTFAAAVVAAVVVTIAQVGGSTDSAPPVAPTSSLPSSAPATSAPGPIEQAEWDPRTADDLPAARDDLAPLVPDTIDPPAASPALADEPDVVAVLAVEEGGTVHVLTTDATWRTVPTAGGSLSVDVSPGGNRLTVDYYAGTEGATVWDLATGASRVLPFPEDYRPYEHSWRFVNDDTLLLVAGPDSWTVNAFTGAAERTPEPVTGLSIAVDPAGELLSSADFDEPNVLTDHAGGRARKVSMARTGRLSSLHASVTTVVGTTYNGRPFSVLVADRRTLTPQTVLPIRNPDDNYGKGGLAVAGLAKHGTVLLRVTRIGPLGDGFNLVAWDPVSGDLSRVADNPVTRQVVFAQHALTGVE